MLRKEIDMEAISREVPKPLETKASPRTETLVTHKSLQLFRFLKNEVVQKGTGWVGFGQEYTIEFGKNNKPNLMCWSTHVNKPSFHTKFLYHLNLACHTLFIELRPGGCTHIGALAYFFCLRIEEFLPQNFPHLDVV